MLEFPIPPDAKPHEVAIITFYATDRRAKLVAEHLHYRDVRPVQHVLAKYRNWLIRYGVIPESPLLSRIGAE